MTKHTTFVNKEQTPEQRRNKYKLAKVFGLSSKDARIIRDWRKGHFMSRLMRRT